MQSSHKICPESSLFIWKPVIRMSCDRNYFKRNQKTIQQQFWNNQWQNSPQGLGEEKQALGRQLCASEHWVYYESFFSEVSSLFCLYCTVFHKFYLSHFVQNLWVGQKPAGSLWKFYVEWNATEFKCMKGSYPEQNSLYI